MALAPHSRRIWIAAGNGNNGGDGLVAARHLYLAGKSVVVTLLGDPSRLPVDAAWALAQATEAGVTIHSGLPPGGPIDIAIDALLGIGGNRAPQADVAMAIDRLNGAGAPILAVDVPSGLNAATGALLGSQAVRASHCLALLTIKPGLFTGAGRDHAGKVWFDPLGIDVAAPATAHLGGPPTVQTRMHVQHKGSFGDVVIIGGAPGMAGAAMLAAAAALTAGAGRVFVARLDAQMSPSEVHPELMPRTIAAATHAQVLNQATVVCGCGGSMEVRDVLPQVLRHALRLVLDADALNAIAADGALLRALQARAGRDLHTIVTPHPLEAARLLGLSTAEVQADRLAAADLLASRLRCTAVLKGSGTVVAAPGATTIINPTGNARLASGGTGDVLAGWMGGVWSQHQNDAPFDLAAGVAWQHGRAAEQGPLSAPLRAADLIEAMASGDVQQATRATGGGPGA